MAGGDHVAVQVAGPFQGKITAEHGDHRAIEEGEAVGGPALFDQRATFADRGRRDEVAVAQPRTQLTDRPGAGDHRLLVRTLERPLHLDQVAQVPGLRAVLVVGQ